MAQITVRDLALGYDSHVIADKLNFSVSSGDYLCIVGENGSGKTTLMKTLLHLQPPIKGEIIIGDGLKANEIGYLPQQTVVQKDFPASVSEIVLSGFQSQMGFRPFYNRSPGKTWTAWEFRPLRTVAIGIFPAGSSRECCWRVRCVQREKCFCWMNRSPVWIRR